MSPFVVICLAGLLSSQVSAQLPPAAIANTPITSRCAPNFTLVRDAGPNASQSLAPAEAAYISARTSSVLPSAWQAYLSNVQASSPSPLPPYVSSILSGTLTPNNPACPSCATSPSLPRLGIASSGGGYRAAIFGAGILAALDGRNASSRAAGTGGLLQASTYHAGLSGGSWLVGSLSQANFPPIQDLIFGARGGIVEGNNGTGGAPPTNPNPPGSGMGGPNKFYGGWNAQFDLFSPNNNTAADAAFIGTLLSEMAGKFAAGYPVTFNDLWSRALSRHFVNGTNGTTLGSFLSGTSSHGAGVRFSDIVDAPTFARHQQPFPIVIGNSISPGQNDADIGPGAFVPLPNVIYEFTPYETGSYDPTLSAFVPTKFLGSRNSSVCVTNYDQAAFVLGTSSELFNQFNSSLPALLSSAAGPLFVALNHTFPQPPSLVELDATYYPNPFLGLKSDTFLDSDESFIRMVDGGDDGEVIPFQPLLVKARGVDVILAIDASNGNNGFATGASLIASQNRTTFFPSTYSFPPVPSTAATFLAQGLVNRPTFFGCDSAHTINSTNSTTDTSTPPLIIYIANGGPPPGEPALTNTPTLQIQYEPEQIQGMLDQVFTIATQGIPPSLTSSTNSTKRHNNNNDSSTGDKDPEWAACLACAIVDRARARSGVQRSGVCVGCMERYCWDGSEVGGGGSGSGGGGGSGSGTGVPGSGGGGSGSGSGTGTNGTGTGGGSGSGTAVSAAIKSGGGVGKEMALLLTVLMSLTMFITL